MRHTAQLALLLMATSAPVFAQSAAPAGMANPAAGVGPASSTSTSTPTAIGPATPGVSAAPAGTAGGTVTGVPRYHAGRRGKPGTPAAVDTTSDISITGKGDHTGTGGGGISPGTLDVPQFHNALGIRTGMPIHVKLKAPVDSGHAKNGDMLDGVLARPLGSLPVGTPVKLTVVAAAPAGQMRSCGELSVQVVSIDGQTVLSNVITAEGEEGKKTMADDAPTRGTEAALTPDQPLVLPAA